MIMDTVGKTMLMDMFYSATEGIVKHRRRYHFHEVSFWLCFDNIRSKFYDYSCILCWSIENMPSILFNCLYLNSQSKLCSIIIIYRLCLKLMNICIRYGRIKWRESLCSLAFLVGLWIFPLIQKSRSGWLQKKGISKRYRWKIFFLLWQTSFSLTGDRIKEELAFFALMKSRYDLSFAPFNLVNALTKSRMIAYLSYKKIYMLMLVVNCILTKYLNSQYHQLSFKFCLLYVLCFSLELWFYDPYGLDMSSKVHLLKCNRNWFCYPFLR